MKKLALNITIIALIIPTIFLHSQAWEIKQGEKLKFTISFHSMLTGNIKGGDAVMMIMPKTTTVNGKEVYQASLTGGTSGVIEWFYKVDNKYQSFIDTETYAPVMFTENVRENKYKRIDTIYFDQKGKNISYLKKNYRMSTTTHDILSIFYYARSIDFSKYNVGDTFTIPFFIQKEITNSKILYSGKKKIKTNLGTFDCYTFKPEVMTGKTFDDKYPATIYVTADANRYPIYIESKLKVGKIVMQMVK